MIVAGIATMERRQDALRDTIGSLTGQVDHIFVCCNDYDGPVWKYEPDNVTWLVGTDHGDAGKFKGIGRLNEDVFFSCDDDLIYPPDYVRTTVKALDDLPGCFVSYHGRIMQPNWESYYAHSVGFPCLGDVSSLIGVHTAGTGVMAFCPRDVDIDVQRILDGPRNMADIHVAVQAHESQTPLFVLPHNAGWIKHTEKIDLDDTIWAWSHNDDRVQSDLLRSVKLRRYSIED